VKVARNNYPAVKIKGIRIAAVLSSDQKFPGKTPYSPVMPQIVGKKLPGAPPGTEKNFKSLLILGFSKPRGIQDIH